MSRSGLSLTDDGCLKIDPAYLREGASADVLHHLAQGLGIDRAVIDEVVSQLITGYTTDSWYASSQDLDAAREKIVAALGDDVTRHIVKHALWDRDVAQQSERRTSEWAWGAMRVLQEMARDGSEIAARVDRIVSYMPPTPQFTFPSDDAIEKWIEERRAEFAAKAAK